MDKERVLFIGAGARSLEMIELMEQRRYDVFHATDADEALEALQVQRFGLIVCDPSISLDEVRRHAEDPEPGWLVELHDCDGEPSLKRRTNGASTEAVIAGLGDMERVTELLDRLLGQQGEFAPDPTKHKGPASLSLPILDQERFCRQMNNDPAMMSEIIDLYVKETEHQLKELEAMVLQQDRVAACRQAHTLKGSFGAVFASRSGALAREIETALAASDFGLAVALLEPLKKSAAGAEAALHQFIEVK